MNFAACFILRGHDTHIDSGRHIVSGRHDLSSDARALSSTSFET